MRHGILKIVSFEYTGGYSLRVNFEDGKIIDVDLAPILKGPMFGPLKNTEIFHSAKIDPEVGTIVWPNGADFDPETLYNWESVSEELASRLNKCW